MGAIKRGMMATLGDLGYDIRRTYQVEQVDTLKPYKHPVGKLRVRGLAWSLYPAWCQYAFWWRAWFGGLLHVDLRQRILDRRGIPGRA